MVADGYKQTEYGLIPNDWIDTEFQNALDGFSSGMTPYRGIPEYYKGSIRWITSGELNYNTIYDTIEHITLDAVKKTNLKILPKGTFLMAITGLEAAGTRGSCAIVGAEATTNQSCMAIFSTRKLSVEYFYHFYVKYGNLLAFKYCQGTKQQSYTAKIAKVLPIIYPPDAKEQQAIATALSDTDELINSLDKLISKKEAIKTGTMQELLTGKKRLDGFSGDWEVKMIKEIASIQTGSKNTQDKVTDGNYPFYVRSQTIESINTYSFDGEAVLTAGDGVGVGKVFHYVNGKFDYHQRVYNICNFKINGFFFYQYFKNNFFDRAMSMTAKSSVDSVRKEMISEMEIPIPPTIKEQTAIATILSDMDSDIDALKIKISKVKAIKEGMMQELLTGRTRLV